MNLLEHYIVEVTSVEDISGCHGQRRYSGMQRSAV